MTGHIFQLHGDPHREVLALLPWFVTDRLDAQDSARVTAPRPATPQPTTLDTVEIGHGHPRDPVRLNTDLHAHHLMRQDHAGRSVPLKVESGITLKVGAGET